MTKKKTIKVKKASPVKAPGGCLYCAGSRGPNRTLAPVHVPTSSSTTVCGRCRRPLSL